MTEHIDAVVTGGGSGIGRSVALALANRGLGVMVVGRRRDALTQTCRLASRRMVPLSADLTRAQGPQAVADALPDNTGLRCLVHNAGMLEPVAPLAAVTPEQWQRNMALNLDAPLFLTQALLGSLQGARVLAISSGAAHHALAGWGAYCTAKAALRMLQQCLQVEHGERGVSFASVRPGVVDTDMQTLIRGQREQDFPQVERFRTLAREGRLHAAQAVGEFIARLLLDCPAAEFAAQEWNFDDPSHRDRWR